MNQSSYIFSDAFNITDALSKQLYIFLLFAHCLKVILVAHVQIGGRSVDRCRRSQIVSGSGGQVVHRDGRRVRVTSVMVRSTRALTTNCHIVRIGRRVGRRGRDRLERVELVLFVRHATQDAEQVRVVVVLNNVAHLGHVVQREQGNVLVALAWRAWLRVAARTLVRI
jgi:hypothetical protein